MKLFSAFLTFLLGLFLLTSYIAPAYAQAPTIDPNVIDGLEDAAGQRSLNPCPEGSDLPTCNTVGLNVGSAVGVVIQFVFVIAVILALGFLVYGGIRWITSGGDKDSVAAARSTIVAALIGLILVFLAYVVLNLVLIFLTGAGIGGITIPSLNDLS